MELLQNGFFKQLYSFQWEQNHKRHCWTDADAWYKWALKGTWIEPLVLGYQSDTLITIKAEAILKANSRPH